MNFTITISGDDPNILERIITALRPSKVATPVTVPVQVDTPTEVAVTNEERVDAAGVPFDPEIHTGTLKKDGTWRLRKGAADRLPPKPVEDQKPEQEPVKDQKPEQEPVEDQEPEKEPVEDQEPELEPELKLEWGHERDWTDADLSVACNRAAIELKSPEPVKALIARYVPQDEIVHSRNIPASMRGAFLRELQNLAGIDLSV